MTKLTIRWAEPAELDAAADFLASVVRLDERYISHGEIQTGLSLDGHTWAPDLEQKMRADMADLGPDRRVVVAHEGEHLVGAGVVLSCFDDRARYVVIEDVAVSPKARSGGVGRAVMNFVEDAARQDGADWAFLESGLDNDRAHAFFKRMDYQPRSKVFGKRL